MEYKKNLDEIAVAANYGKGLNGRMIVYGSEVFGRWIRQEGTTLELGPADGDSTARLLEFSPNLEVLEGSEVYVRELTKRFPNLKIHHSLFEDFRPQRRYSTIVASHVLEHVEDPLLLARQMRKWLAPRGRLIISTPNSMSLHRQVGASSGHLGFEAELGERDFLIGHRRVLSGLELRKLAQQVGLDVLHFGGFFLKCFSNGQIEKVADDSVLDALMKVGERYPDIAADIYVVAEAT